MAIKIGLRDVANLQPNSILWDSIVRGFCCRRQRSETITFYVAYRSKDRSQHWFKLGRYPVLTPHLARQEAIRVLRAVTLGDDPASERHDARHGMTVAELCDQYMAEVESGRIGKKPETIRADKSRIKTHIRPKLGKLKVSSITSEQIDDFMRSMSVGSQSRTIGLVSAIFSWGIKKKICTVNPCVGVIKPPGVRRTRRLSEVEYRQLGGALKGWLVSDIFLLLAVTGFRSGEVKKLRFDECDFDRNIVRLSDTKTGVSVRPLSNAAIEIIKRQKQTGAPYVFDCGDGKPIESMRYQWLKLGLDKTITPHCLRHSFASLSADLGLADSTIAGMIGHKQQSMTSRYLHLDKALVSASNIVASETLKFMRISLGQ